VPKIEKRALFDVIESSCPWQNAQLRGAKLGAQGTTVPIRGTAGMIVILLSWVAQVVRDSLPCAQLAPRQLKAKVQDRA
jgi:hypothetical protein